MELPRFYGIDIGRSTTKVAVIEWNKDKAKLVKAFSFTTGEGGLTSEDPEARSQLAIKIRDAIAGSKINTRKCVVAIPEPVVFNRLLTFPDLEGDSLSQAIHWNAKQFIPIPIDDVQMDWIKTGETNENGKKNVQLLLVAAPKKVINQTVGVFKEAEQDLIAIETESVATSRAIAHNYKGEGSFLVLDIGSSGTDLSVVSGENLIFSQSLGTGSDAMTKAISNKFNIDMSQAEQYKIKFGLNQNEGDGKIYSTLEPVVNIISDEVTKTINFFKSKYQQSTPQKVLIVGEGGKVPGLPSFLANKLGLSAEIAQMDRKLEVEDSVRSELPTTGLIGFAVAIGLALKQK